MPYLAELKKIGLSDKEAAVYHAALGLGPETVQNIARRSKVARGTTYVVLESLMEMGLISQYREGKKTLFVASSPRQLVRLLDRREEVLHQHRNDLKRLLPELQAFMKASGGQPNARYYSGPEGLRSMRQEMVRVSKSGDVWYHFTPIDYLFAMFGEGDPTFTRMELAKGIKVKTIFTTTSDQRKTDVIQKAPANRIQRKFIATKEFRSTTGMTIFRDQVAIGNFAGRIGGVMIDSGPTADMLRELFEALWKRL